MLTQSFIIVFCVTGKPEEHGPHALAALIELLREEQKGVLRPAAGCSAWGANRQEELRRKSMTHPC